jgi:predicted DCC family thiol-disulfide oxidoreductase YuxK
MEIKENIPIVLFDNQCYLCMKFAKMINFFARDKITMVGHYSEFGEKIRKSILDESALDMFWFINQKRACGGRAALLPLLKSILSEKTKKSSMSKMDDDCEQDCKTIKAVFVRSSSLITNSKIIDL